MNAIKITSGIEVKVNEKGETIIINVEDQTFLDKFYGLIHRMDETQQHMKSDKVKALGEREQLREMIAQTQEIMKDIDGLFGEGACRKIFGDIVPSPYLLGVFFEKMLPLADSYADERQKNISRMYSRSRKGGGNRYREVRGRKG